MALWHMPQTQQENSHDVPQMQLPLELWHQTSHDTQGSTSLSKCKLGFLGEMGTGMAKMGRRSEMAATEATFCFKTQNKEPKNAKWQRQGIRPQGQRWKGHFRFFCTCLITICTPCTGARTMAFTGDHYDGIIQQCFDAIHSIGSRCCSYGRGLERGLPGREGASSKCQGHDRESRKGGSQRRDERSPLCYKFSQEGTENACREYRGQTATQSPMGKTCERSHSDLARTVTGIQKATDCFPGNQHQGQERYRASQEHDPAAQRQSSWNGIGRYSPCAQSGDRGLNRGGQGGREAQTDYAKCLEELCTVPGHRFGRSEDTGGSPRDPLRGRGASQQASSFHGTLRWRGWLSYAIVSFGGVLPVHQNGVHGAWPCADLVHDRPFLLSDNDVFKLLPWSHSIWDEPSFLYPFDAVLRAQCLALSLFREDSDCMIGLLQKDHDLIETPGTAMLASLQPPRIISSFSPEALKPCISQGSRNSAHRCSHVSFHDRIDLYIGLEEETKMQHFRICEDLLTTWNEKPWQLRSQPDDDPQSFQAVLISREEKMHFIHARLTDEFENIPRRVAAASTEPTRTNQEQPRHFPPPAFANDIFGLPGFLALPHDFLVENSFVIRTWYVHHFHYPRWVVPRLVELDHRWPTWQREITGAWRDMIRREEDVQFFTVMPDPDRSYIPRQVIADVLVVQGIDADRYAGLLTVHQQTERGHLRPFALAISLPDEVSGMGLAAAADIAHLCNTQNCNFYFRWQQIPFSLIPAHYMLDGHGFAVHITPRPRQAATGSGEPRHDPQSTAAHGRARQDQDANSHEGHDFSERSEEDAQPSDRATDTSIPDSPAQFENWQGVQIYRLGRHVTHCFVRWGTYNSILHDIARFLREHLRNLVGIHHVQTPLAGQHEAEDSIILQHVDDLAPGSLEQLIILDVEVHFQQPAEGMLRAPEVSRRVHRIVSQVSRSHVLRLARLANYCFLQGDRCLVFHNNALWPEQDVSVHTVQHGCYLKVVATPPLDHTVTTETALNFAISIDDAEVSQTRDYTAVPRSQHSLALMQTHASCRPGFDQDRNPLHIHLHRHAVEVDSQLETDYNWLDKLADRFSQFAMVECSDEGPVAYISTWFIDHLLAPRCEASRPVRLVGSEGITWRQLIIDAWADKIDPFLTISFSIVKPQPPTVETESTLLHVLLVQHESQASHAAGLISTIRQDMSHAYVQHVAVSTACTTVLRQILQLVRLVDLCVLRRCTVWYGRSEIRPGHIEDLSDGFCILVHVPPQGWDEAPFPRRLWTPGMAAAMDSHTASFADIQDDVAFLQQSSNITMNAASQLISCKPSPHGPEEERGFPAIHPSQEPQQWRRPLHDGADDWIAPIGELFPLYGILNAWDDERLLPITTWYIHHDNRIACRRPRDVQLSEHPVFWIEDLRNAWIDLLDPNLPFAIHVVKPRPPQFRTQQRACHVILEQKQQPERAAVVLTALFEGPTNDGIIQGAFSVLRRVDLNYIINTLEIAFFCTQRSCSFLFDSTEQPAEIPFGVRSGDSIRVKVAQPVNSAGPDDSVEQLHFEDLRLMQQPSHPSFTRRWQQSRRPNRARGAGPPRNCDGFQFDPNAPEFRPHAPSIAAQSEFVQSIHELWIPDAFAWEDESPSIGVLVWFVDHRSPSPKCYVPRLVRLYDDFTDWEQRIRAAWSDFLQTEVANELTIVQPTPPMLEHGVTGHVIMVQAPRDDWSTSLVSVRDSRLGPIPLRIAITTSEHLTFEQVVRGVHYEDLCSHAAEPVRCHLWYQQVQVTPGHPLQCWTGYSLDLQVIRNQFPQPQRPQRHQDEEAHSDTADFGYAQC